MNRPKLPPGGFISQQLLRFTRVGDERGSFSSMLTGLVGADTSANRSGMFQ
jgi:hypothetical protein